MPVKEIPFKSYINGPSTCMGITNPLRAEQLTFLCGFSKAIFGEKGVGTGISHSGGGGVLKQSFIQGCSTLRIKSLLFSILSFICLQQKACHMLTAKIAPLSNMSRISQNDRISYNPHIFPGFQLLKGSKLLCFPHVISAKTWQPFIYLALGTISFGYCDPLI